MVFILLLHYCKSNSAPKDGICLSQVVRLGMPHVSQKWESFLRLKRVSSTNSSSHPAMEDAHTESNLQCRVESNGKKRENLTQAQSIVLWVSYEGKQALCIHFVSMTCVLVYYTCPFPVVYINFPLKILQTDSNVIIIRSKLLSYLFMFEIQVKWNAPPNRLRKTWLALRTPLAHSVQSWWLQNKPKTVKQL